MDKRLSLMIGIFAVLTMMILNVNMVSAGISLNPFADKMIPVDDKNSVDDYLKSDFNAQYGVIQISKSFLWIATDKMAEYSLISNTEKCYIDCSASGKAVLYTDGALFDDFDVVDLSSKDKVNIPQFQTYLDVEEEYQVEVADTFKKVCSTTLPLEFIGLADDKGVVPPEIERLGIRIELRTDGKEICKDIVDTYKNITKTRIVQRVYNGEVLKAGSYSWSIQAKKDPKQSLDWAVGIRGVSTDQVREKWATWTTADCYGYGGTVTIDGDYCVNTFTSNGTFVVNATVGTLNVSYLVVGAGGQGGTWSGGGGAGGGVIYNTTGTNATGSIAVVVAPAVPKATSNSQGTSGGNSAFGSVTATGGGGGGASAGIGKNGGSGGGGSPATTTNGTGIAGQGNDGAIASNNCGGGGGGKGGVGVKATASTSGNGGAGLQININGTNSYYGAGAGGIWYGGCGASVGGAGQSAGAGIGGNDGGANKASDGAGGYGFGGGGAWDTSHADYGGGSTQGVVIVRYSAGLRLGLTTVLSTPIDAYNTTSSSITFGCNVTGTNVNVTSVKLNVTGTASWIQTISGLNQVQYNATFTNTTIGDGSYNWTCLAYGDIANATAPSVRSFNRDGSSPTIYGLNNVTNISTLTFPINSTHYFNVTDANLGSCKYWTSDNSTNTTITCNSSFNILWNAGGSKTVYAWVNDTFGNLNQTSGSFNIYDFNVTQSGETTAGEGSSQTFTLLVNSTSFAIGDASANLWYDGSNKGYTTKTAMGSNAYYFTSVFTIPTGTGNSTGKDINWYWNYNATQLTTRNTSTQTQTVYNVTISDCVVLGGDAILNLTLKDEELNSLVNITSPNVANIEIDLDITSWDNSTQIWNFHKDWNSNNTISICVPNGLLSLASYKIDFVIGYDSTDHVREFYYMENGTLDNTDYFNSYTDNTIDLMDLLTTDSTSFLFEYTDNDALEVEDIIVHTYRKYIGEGLFREVERSKQDDSGQTHVHLVEEDVIYYFVITQYGNIIYTSETYNAKCLSSPCEISLSASTTDTNWSIIDNEGGQYSVSSDKTTRIVTTTFSLDSSDEVNATLYRYYDGIVEVVNSSTLTATSGSVLLHVPLTYNNATFFVAIYNNGEFIKSVWVDLTEGAIDYFGTFGAILGGLVVLAMMLMAVSEGAGFIIFTILALILVTIMQLVDLGWMALISIICAGGIILWKLVSRRRQVG